MKRNDTLLVELVAQCRALRAVLGCVVEAMRTDEGLETALGFALLHARTEFEEMGVSPVGDEAEIADRALEFFDWIEGKSATE